MKNLIMGRPGPGKDQNEEFNHGKTWSSEHLVETYRYVYIVFLEV